MFKAKNVDDFECVGMLCRHYHALNTSFLKKNAFSLDLVVAAFLGCQK